jgi:adenine-specific DNA-methyltransferase
MKNNLKKNRGQFFTTKKRVLDVLVSLIKNNGSILEPSAGEGHIVREIENNLHSNVISIEIDSEKIKNKVCNSKIECDNFFNFINKGQSFDTIIGNPPFVKLKKVEDDTIKLLPEKIPANGNLYYFFIKYCVNLLKDRGELIFIVPKEWLYNVSSQFVRDFLKETGGFTHFIDCGEEKLFDDADVPALCIFRFEKNYKNKVKYFTSLDDYNRGLFREINTIYSNTIYFSDFPNTGKTISDFFDVKVGLVSGAEKIFKLGENDLLDCECVINIIGTNKLPSRYIFIDNYDNVNDIPTDAINHLLPFKDKLLKRKISNFSDKNWWKYGALRNFESMRSDRVRIYGLLKTRNNEIFWKGNKSEFFGGGVVGLFLKSNINIDLDNVVKYLNSEYFKKIMRDNNMYSNNKVSITPSVLAGLPFNYSDTYNYK